MTDGLDQKYKKWSVVMVAMFEKEIVSHNDHGVREN